MLADHSDLYQLLKKPPPPANQRHLTPFFRGFVPLIFYFYFCQTQGQLRPVHIPVSTATLYIGAWQAEFQDIELFNVKPHYAIGRNIQAGSDKMFCYPCAQPVIDRARLTENVCSYPERAGIFRSYLYIQIP